MKPFTKLHSIAVPFPRENVDTDLIIPKQFLTTISRQGLAKGLFYDLRHDDDGRPVAGCPLDEPAYDGAAILITGDNFGCGSSREHAPWALLDAGFRCLIAAGFADIFYNNCFKNGMLPIVLPRREVDALMAYAGGGKRALAVDLATQEVRSGDDTDGAVYRFAIDPFRKRCLLEGLSDIALTLKSAGAIKAWEEDNRRRFPWLWRAPHEAGGDSSRQPS